MTKALLASGSKASFFSNIILGQCIRPTGHATMFNHMIAGDTALGVVDDVYHVAALLERMVRSGDATVWSHAEIEVYAKRKDVLALERSVLGTFADFSQTLATLVGERTDAKTADERRPIEGLLTDVICRSLIDDLSAVTDVGANIRVLHGGTRDWFATGAASERLAKRQVPVRKSLDVREGDFIQFVVPPGDRDQVVFGSEIRTDIGVVRDPWDQVGGWLAPRVQKAGRALAILDEPANDGDAFRAEIPGEFAVQVICIPIAGEHEHGDPAALPPEMTKLINPVPDWPEGYAESVALVTYARRLAKQHKESIARHARELARATAIELTAVSDAPVFPARARLHTTRYNVV